MHLRSQICGCWDWWWRRSGLKWCCRCTVWLENCRSCCIWGRLCQPSTDHFALSLPLDSGYCSALQKREHQPGRSKIAVPVESWLLFRRCRQPPSHWIWWWRWNPKKCPSASEKPGRRWPWREEEWGSLSPSIEAPLKFEVQSQQGYFSCLFSANTFPW